MSKTFYAADEGTGFKVAIWESGFRSSGTNDLFLNPMTSNNLTYLMFHSDLSFFRSPSSVSVNLSLPARAVGQNCGKKKGRCVPVPNYGTATYTLTTGNYTGKIVTAVDTTSARSIVGTMFVQRLGDSSFRAITVYSNATGIYADEQFFAYSNDLPAITLNIKLFVLSTITENRTATGEKLYISPTEFRVNDSLFNANYGYVDVNIDSSSASYANLYSGYYCSWNSTEAQSSVSIKRYIIYDPTSNTTFFYWDAYKRYDGTWEGIADWTVGNGQLTAKNIQDYTYERGSLFATKLGSNGAVDYYVYQIRRYKSVATSVSRTGGVALPNGPTLKVESTPGFTGAGFSYSFDGYSAKYGDISTYPVNTVYALNLI